MIPFKLTDTDIKLIKRINDRDNHPRRVTSRDYYLTVSREDYETIRQINWSFYSGYEKLCSWMEMSRQEKILDIKFQGFHRIDFDFFIKKLNKEGYEF